MKILYAGKAHKRTVWYPVCEFCETKVRIMEGDPYANRFRNNYNPFIALKWKCPICEQFNEDYEVKPKTEILTKEDREEIETWESTDVSAEDKKELNTQRKH